MEPQDLAQTTDLLQKNWGLTPPTQLDWESLREALRLQMAYMISNNFEFLVQTMYRLDVDESKFLQALSLPMVADQAATLATIIVDRELQRLETWRKYSGRS
jgi:hypothetical protein